MRFISGLIIASNMWNVDGRLSEGELVEAVGHKVTIDCIFDMLQ